MCCYYMYVYMVLWYIFFHVAIDAYAHEVN